MSKKEEKGKMRTSTVFFIYRESLAADSAAINDVSAATNIR